MYFEKPDQAEQLISKGYGESVSMFDYGYDVEQTLCSEEELEKSQRTGFKFFLSSFFNLGL